MPEQSSELDPIQPFSVQLLDGVVEFQPLNEANFIVAFMPSVESGGSIVVSIQRLLESEPANSELTMPEILEERFGSKTIAQVWYEFTGDDWAKRYK